MTIYPRRLGRRAALLACAAGLVVMQSLAPATALIRPATTGSASTGSATAAAATTTPCSGNSSVTVTGPHMYDPQTQGPYPNASTVTVSQATNLVNQTLSVCWTNFTPSVHVPYSNFLTQYPVMVAVCPGASPGTSPANLTLCYVGQSGLSNSNGKYGPTTEAYGVTTANGTGSVTVQVQTAVQNQQLGCDVNHVCSLLILPADGGYPGEPGVPQHPANCTDHKQDRTWATGNLTFNPPAAPGQGTGEDTCAWLDGIVVPLHFATSPANCGFTQADFSVVGSPFMERAMTSWASSLCHGSSPLHVSYDGLLSEPQARTLFAQGATDVALTTQPASGPTAHPYTYAPVGISAAAFAYWLDSTKIGQSYPSGVQMNPRLMAKELTQSYTYGFACVPPKKPPPIIPSGCDPNVMGDKASLLADPEFKALNPAVKNLYSGGPPAMVPTVEGDASDLTWELTRWIGADTTATQFLAGHFDPYGQHVNTTYLGTTYPTNTIQAADPTGVQFFSFLPTPTPDKASFYESLNWWPGLDWNNPQPNPCGKPGFPACSYGAQPAETPGRRELAAITNNADATAFLMPVAALENHAGKYVLPTQASMAAAVSAMTTASNGITKDDNTTTTNPAVYPLTLVSYAMVPTGGISHQMAVKIAQWLTFVANAGQVQGSVPGQLPLGYLPLPTSMRQQTLKAAYAVLHQTGNHGSHGSPGGGSGSGSGSGSGNGSSGSGTHGTGTGKTPSSGSVPRSKANAAYSSPDSNAAARLVLPILLALGALLALAGPGALVLSRPGARTRVISAWHRVQALGRGARP